MKGSGVRIVTLEDHFIIPDLVKGSGLEIGFLPPALLDPLSDMGAQRLQGMDASGITVQVMSATLPSADLLNGDEGIRFARVIPRRAESDSRRGFPSG